MNAAAEYTIYRKLAKDRRKLLDESILNVEEQLSRMYRASSRRIINEITNLYSKIISGVKQGQMPSMNDLYQYNRYYEMLSNIQSEIKALGGKEELAITKNLTNLYKLSSNKVNKSIGLSSSIDKKSAEAAIKRVWAPDGVTFSTRIWHKQSVLTNVLSVTLSEAVATGKSVDWLSKELQNKFNVSFNDARRLARTEMSHAHNQAALDRYNEAGIKEYVVITANDDKVCGKCQELNNKKFSIQDTEHLPPAGSHP